MAAIKAQVKRELEAEKKEKLQQTQPTTTTETVTVAENTNLAVQGVYFRYLVLILLLTPTTYCVLTPDLCQVKREISSISLVYCRNPNTFGRLLDMSN